MNQFRLVVLAVAALFAQSGATSVHVPPVDIEITAADGARLKGSYFSPGRPGPGILLLHQCNMDRQSWNGLGAALAARGIHVLTFDHRGYGENRALPRGGATTPSIGADIDAAFAALGARPGVERSHLAAGGASCGVDWSIHLAMRDTAVRALVLLSGTTTPEGLAFIAKRATLPVFGAASRDDGNAVEHTGRIVRASKHSASTMREFTTGGHGVPMFSAQPTLMPAIVDWVSTTLKP
jgi:dienelactone hydrolase